MLGRLKKIFARDPVEKTAAIQEVADFCAALTEAFSNRLPDRFAISLPIQAAWWAVALYVQLPMRLKMRRFDEEVWRAASRAIAVHMMDRLFPDFPEEGPEKGDLVEALQG